MKFSKVVAFACTAALSAALAATALGCSQKPAESDSLWSDPYDLSGGVAAVVNDVEIGENAITQYIASFRAANNLQDESAWAQWLVDMGYTPEAARKDVIGYFVEQEVARQGAASQGIQVSSTDVDNQIASMKANFESEEAWQEALTSIGTTEAGYRASIEQKMLEQGLFEKVAVASEPTAEDMLNYSKMYSQAYNGAKKSSHILFKADDEATAREVLEKIKSGELDFATAAAQYSLDTGSASDGGNVGWNCLATFVSEYSKGLEGLEQGQVSDLVKSEFGIHIIKCTEVFTAPEEVTSPDQLPAEFVEVIKASLESNSKKASFGKWLEDFKTNSTIVINDMPEGLPYVVDTTGYTKSQPTMLPNAQGAPAEGEGQSGDAAQAPSTSER